MGRPSEYSQEMADVICGELIEGRSLRAICGREGFPSASTVCRWLARHGEFQRQYAFARKVQADLLADEILQIADDTREDYVTKEVRGKEVEAFNAENVSRSRLRVDARKWLAAKLAPTVYGDKGETAADEVDAVQALFDGIRKL